MGSEHLRTYNEGDLHPGDRVTVRFGSPVVVACFVYVKDIPPGRWVGYRINGTLSGSIRYKYDSIELVEPAGTWDPND